MTRTFFSIQFTHIRAPAERRAIYEINTSSIATVSYHATITIYFSDSIPSVLRLRVL